MLCKSSNPVALPLVSMVPTHAVLSSLLPPSPAAAASAPKDIEAHRSVDDTAAPIPRLWDNLPTVSVDSVLPVHHKITILGRKPTPVTATVDETAPVPVLNAPTFADSAIIYPPELTVKVYVN